MKADSAKQQCDSTDFRATELEARLDGDVRALQQRVVQRFDTLRRLRGDVDSKVRSAVEGELKALVKLSAGTLRNPLEEDSIKGVHALIAEMHGHLNVQGGALSSEIAAASRDARQRIAGVERAAECRSIEESTKTMRTLLESFQTQITQQIHQLRVETQEYERTIP